MHELLSRLKPGIYVHYKGPLYLVLGLAHDANAEDLFYEYFANGPQYTSLGERRCVVYVGLQLNEAHTGPRLAVRTLEDFFAEVCIQPEHTHYGQPVQGDDPCRKVHRFVYLGPELTSEMM